MKKWETSKKHSNVVIVNKWRNKHMENTKDQETIDKLLPTLRKVFITTHQRLSKVYKFVCSPVTWFLEQVDGTADWKFNEQRIDSENSRKQRE